MKNGNVREFVEHVHYGDELWFLFGGKKYFLEGWNENGTSMLLLYEMSPDGVEYVWTEEGETYPVKKFLDAKIWNGKAFWDAEQEMTWVDC